MTDAKRVTDEVLWLHRGQSYAAIARRIGVSAGTVSRVAAQRGWRCQHGGGGVTHAPCKVCRRAGPVESLSETRVCPSCVAHAKQSEGVNLVAERAAAAERHEAEMLAGRARRLLSAVGFNPDPKQLDAAAEQEWPKFDAKTRAAIVGRAVEFATAKKQQGRRLSPAEVEAAATQIKERVEMAMEISNEEARAYTIGRIREAPEVAYSAIHRELKAKGYDRAYSTFYSSIVTPVKKELAAEAPAAAGATPTTAATEPEAGETGGSTGLTTPEGSQPRPEAEPLVQKIEAMHADVDDDSCSIRLVIVGRPALIENLTALAAAIRGVAA